MESIRIPILVKVKDTEEIIQLDPRIKDKSEFIRKTYEDNSTEPIPLQLKKGVLDKVISYLEHYAYGDIKPLEKPVKTSDFGSITDEWTNNFF